MGPIANISFPTKPDDNDSITKTVSGSSDGPENQHINNTDRFIVCPKLIKRLFSNTSKSSAPGLDGIRWQEVKIWFLINPAGFCELIDYLIYLFIYFISFNVIQPMWLCRQIQTHKIADMSERRKKANKQKKTKQHT
jgi:hypothetical protein